MLVPMSILFALRTCCSSSRARMYVDVFMSWLDRDPDGSLRVPSNPHFGRWPMTWRAASDFDRLLAAARSRKLNSLSLALFLLSHKNLSSMYLPARGSRLTDCRYLIRRPIGFRLNSRHRRKVHLHARGSMASFRLSRELLPSEVRATYDSRVSGGRGRLNRRQRAFSVSIVRWISGRNLPGLSPDVLSPLGRISINFDLLRAGNVLSSARGRLINWRVAGAKIRPRTRTARRLDSFPARVLEKKKKICPCRLLAGI